MTALLRWPARRPLDEIPSALVALAAFAEMRGAADDAAALRAGAADLASLPDAARSAVVRDVARGTGAGSPEIPGVARDAIQQLVSAGLAAHVEQARAAIPPDMRRLLDAPGSTLDEVLQLYRWSHAVTGADLAAAAADPARAGAEAAPAPDRVADLLAWLVTARPRLPLGRAMSVAEAVVGAVRGAAPGGLDQDPVAAGSLRRFEPTVGDVEVLVPATDGAATLGAAVRALQPSAVLHHSAHVVSMIVRQHPATVRAVAPAAYGPALVYATGSAAHWRALRERAAARGLVLSRHAVARSASSAPEPCPTELDLYDRLGLPWIAPELRHGTDELARAVSGTLPTLLTHGDVRGDLHAHTLWSDGRDSVEALAFAARDLGYEYVAITDHSRSAAASRVVTRERLERQAEDVSRAREKVTGLTILHGIEVEILPDGDLDFPDEILTGLDIVLASLHDAAGQSPDRLLARYLRAVHHPLVAIITHPANRVVGASDGYRLDYDALFEAAVATGTALEVDGGPMHLDMDGALAARAVAAGVTITVDSDCHDAARLQRQMRLAVGTARRGGVEPRHVLNTRPLDEILQFVGRKRRASGTGLVR